MCVCLCTRMEGTEGGGQRTDSERENETELAGCILCVIPQRTVELLQLENSATSPGGLNNSPFDSNTSAVTRIVKGKSFGIMDLSDFSARAPEKMNKQMHKQTISKSPGVE